VKIKVVVSGRFALFPKMAKFITRLQKNGIIVLSPEPSKLSGTIGDFTLLASDSAKIKDVPKSKIPTFLEKRHCEFIKECHCLIIYNPDGADGKSILTELGVAFGAGKMIYSLKPIQESAFRKFTRVISQKKLIQILTDHGHR
jgi:hypothetical protein